MKIGDYVKCIKEIDLGTKGKVTIGAIGYIVTLSEGEFPYEVRFEIDYTWVRSNEIIELS
jgi:hypothetical protein